MKTKDVILNSDYKHSITITANIILVFATTKLNNESEFISLMKKQLEALFKYAYCAGYDKGEAECNE